MKTHNPDNERIKRAYFSYLIEAQGFNEATLDGVAKAIYRFETYTKFRDFKAFHKYCVEAAKIAKRALDAKTVSDSANGWRELFGDEFPKPPSDGNDGGGPKKGGFTERSSVSTIGGGRFASEDTE